MSNLTTTSEAMMSSKEIAELTGKRHADVMRDIRAISNHIKKDFWVSESYCSHTNRLSEYHLTIHQAATLVSGYSPDARMKIISRIEVIGIIQALEEFEVPEDLGDMYVYAIRETESGRIKIGISRDPESRIKKLQTGNSQRLELVAYMKAENRYQDEASIHKFLSDFHVRGEWFQENALEVIQ